MDDIQENNRYVQWNYKIDMFGGIKSWYRNIKWHTAKRISDTNFDVGLMAKMDQYFGKKTVDDGEGSWSTTWRNKDPDNDSNLIRIADLPKRASTPDS